MRETEKEKERREREMQETFPVSDYGDINRLFPNNTQCPFPSSTSSPPALLSSHSLSQFVGVRPVTGGCLVECRMRGRRQDE